VLAAGLREQLADAGIETSDQALLEGVAEAQRERAKTLREMAESSRFFFVPTPTYDPKAVQKHLGPEGAGMLEELQKRLAGLSEWSAPKVHELLVRLSEERGVGLGKVAQPLRVAVAGTAVSPPIDQTVALLGRDRTQQRILSALALVRAGG
jgi:glutamyl-tRNA synthetase